MPVDSQGFIDQYKGRDIDGPWFFLVCPGAAGAWLTSADISLAIVEQVRDGSSIRVRLLLEDGSHQFINLVRGISQQ